MKKIFSLLFVSILSFALFSCGKDDVDNNDETSNKKGNLTINGEKYQTIINYSYCAWNNIINLGTLAVGVSTSDYSAAADYYYFYYNCDHEPAAGDELSKMDLTFIPPYSETTYTYKEGTLKIISIEGTDVTCDMNNLVMEYNGDTYTFDGEFKVDLDLDR